MSTEKTAIIAAVGTVVGIVLAKGLAFVQAILGDRKHERESGRKTASDVRIDGLEARLERLEGSINISLISIKDDIGRLTLELGIAGERDRAISSGSIPELKTTAARHEQRLTRLETEVARLTGSLTPPHGVPIPARIPTEDDR